MIRIKKFPQIFVSFYIIGYIFAFFALFYKTKLIFAIVTFAISALINYLYYISDGYRSSNLLIKAKKQIDKGNYETAADLIIQSVQIADNEEVLMQINATIKKNPEHYGEVAKLLEKRLIEYDSPFLRFIIASFYYVVHDLQKCRDILSGIPSEQLTVKSARLLGSVLYELKEYSRAIKIFSQFDPKRLPKNEDEVAVLYGLAVSHLAKDESNKAIEYLERVKAKAPHFGNAEKLLKELKGAHSEN